MRWCDRYHMNTCAPASSFNRSIVVHSRRMWLWRWPCVRVCGVSSFQKRQTCNFLIKCYCKIDRRRKYAMICARCACMRLADTAATTQQNNALTSMQSIPTTDLLFFFCFVFALPIRWLHRCIARRTEDCMVSCARCPHLQGELLLVYFRVWICINIYMKRYDDHNVW